MIQFKKIFTAPVITMIFFGLIYSVISLINHYQFRTNAHDLGIYNNAMYDYARFKMNDDPLVSNLGNMLADHFELLVMVASPLHWIFGSYTLLLIQIAVILFGGYGVYLFFKNRKTHPMIPLLAMIHFYLLWGIYSALSFDYHNNVVGTMFVPWLFVSFDQKKWKTAVLFFTLIIISKENMALWAMFLCGGLLLLYGENRTQRKVAIYLAIVAAVYFITIVTWVMPGLSVVNNEYSHNDFRSLGNNFGEVINYIVVHPIKTFSLLIENQTSNPRVNGIKAELYFTLLLSGGFALALRPAYLFMLIPILCQKMFNDNFERWGVNNHYSIEFAPVLTIALFSWISERENLRKQIRLSSLCIALTILATVNTMDAPISHLNFSENKQFYKPGHYETKYNVKKIYEALKLIPDEAKLSAHASLVPHLAIRDYIRLFPQIDDAEYIALMLHENPYPATLDEFNKKVEELRQSPGWKIIFDNGELIILKKNSV